MRADIRPCRFFSTDVISVTSSFSCQPRDARVRAFHHNQRNNTAQSRDRSGASLVAAREERE
jgi:hypothetical protein